MNPYSASLNFYISRILNRKIFMDKFVCLFFVLHFVTFSVVVFVSGITQDYITGTIKT